MLRSIYINNIAIISKLNLELHEDMTSITGETGAGKSIIIDAVALALGGRADQNLLKHGQDKAEIVLEFDVSKNKQAITWLQENEFELEEQQCVLRRQLFQDKPSKSFINERPVTVQLLKQLGDLLVNICGQQEHLNLVQSKKRVEIVDAHAGNRGLLEKVTTTYKDLKLIRQEIERLQNTDSIDTDQIDMISFLINELEQGNYSAEHYHQLDQEQKRLAHTTDIANAVNTSVQQLKESDAYNVLNSLNESIKLLNSAGKYEPRLAQISVTLTEATIACEDAVSELISIANKIEFSPAELNDIEQKLTAYHDLARKHRCEPDALETKLAALQERLDLIENRDKKLAYLNVTEKTLLDQYTKHASNLSQSRTKSASTLSKSISRHLKELNLADAVFQIWCDIDETKISPNGQDLVEFLVSTNKGEPPGPIDKIASGGELSRISLAVQLEVNNLFNNSVLIFDEVDAGISGETADIVGNKLKSLGKNNQVVCITHLPQVASKAKHQLKISKTSQEPMVELNYLNNEDRIKELARFLSGKKITQESLDNAKIMLQESA